MSELGQLPKHHIHSAPTSGQPSACRPPPCIILPSASNCIHARPFWNLLPFGIALWSHIPFKLALRCLHLIRFEAIHHLALRFLSLCPSPLLKTISQIPRSLLNHCFPSRQGHADHLSFISVTLHLFLRCLDLYPSPFGRASYSHTLFDCGIAHL